MEAEQVFSAYSGKQDGGLGRFKYCPYCGTQLALKAKGGKPRPACSGSLPRTAFEVDEHIIERYQQTELEWGLPVDPDLACLGRDIHTCCAN